ncbi:MAG TPA: hypothetical protein VIE89_20350 [Candidatus Binatia bacterium]
MGKGIAQSLPVDDSQRRDEIVFHGIITIFDHIFAPFFPSIAAPKNKSIRGAVRVSRDNKLQPTQ